MDVKLGMKVRVWVIQGKRKRKLKEWFRKPDSFVQKFALKMNRFGWCVCECAFDLIFPGDLIVSYFECWVFVCVFFVMDYLIDWLICFVCLGEWTHHRRRDSLLQHLNILVGIDRLLIEWHSSRYILTNHWYIWHNISTSSTFSSGISHLCICQSDGWWAQAAITVTTCIAGRVVCSNTLRATWQCTIRMIIIKREIKQKWIRNETRKRERERERKKWEREKKMVNKMVEKCWIWIWIYIGQSVRKNVLNS